MLQQVSMREFEGIHNILIVEDDAADLLLLKKQLTKIWPESKIMAVRSIKDAYDVYKKNNVDLFLLDLNLPDGYGPQTVHEVRKLDKRTPIIVVTGLGNSITVNEALRLGANNVVLKSQIMDSDFANILEQNKVAH